MRLCAVVFNWERRRTSPLLHGGTRYGGPSIMKEKTPRCLGLSGGPHSPPQPTAGMAEQPWPIAALSAPAHASVLDTLLSYGYHWSKPGFFDLSRRGVLPLTTGHKPPAQSSAACRCRQSGACRSSTWAYPPVGEANPGWYREEDELGAGREDPVVAIAW